jgi:hypothetical protein
MSDKPWDFYDQSAITFEPVARQLSLMWHTYGRRESQRCGTCALLIVHAHNNNRYFKCTLYGETCGAGTDWRKKWLACGKWERKDD